MNSNNFVNKVIISKEQLKQWLQSNEINPSVSAVQNRDVVSDNNNSNHKKCSSVKFLGLKRKSFDEKILLRELMSRGNVIMCYLP